MRRGFSAASVQFYEDARGIDVRVRGTEGGGDEALSDEDEIALALQSMAHYYTTYPAGEGDMQFSYECLDENAQISTSKNTWQATWRDESQSFPTQLSLKNEGRTTLFVHAVQTGEVAQEEIEPHAGRAPLSIFRPSVLPIRLRPTGR